MVRALWRKARRDLGSRPGTSLLLTLVVAVATVGIVAGIEQRAGAEQKWDDAFDRANGAHLVLFDKADPPPAGLLADPAISASDRQVPVTRGWLTRGDERIPLSLRGTGATAPTIGTPLPFTGRWLAPTADDEVVLDRSVALGLGIRDGDELSVSGAGGERRLRVVGTALDLIDCFYPQCGSAPAWVSPAVVRQLDPTLDSGSYLLPLRLRDPQDVATVGARLQQQYGGFIGGLNDWQDTRKDALATNGFFSAFLGAFAVVLLLAAALVLSSSLSSRTLAQYREIGMLKAVGFTPSSIVALIVAENAALAAIGIVLGLVAGAFLAPRLQLRFSQVLEGGSSQLSIGSVELAVLAVVVIIGVATALPAWRAGRVPASEAIARGATPRRARPSRLARLAYRLHLGAPVAAGVKDVFSRPLRATLTIATLAVTVLACVVTLGFERSIDRISNDLGLVGNPYDIAVAPTSAKPELVESMLRAEPDVRGWFTATDRRASTPSNGTFLVRAVGGDYAAAGFQVREGHQMRAPGEATVGYGLLRRLGLNVGDRLDVSIDGKPASFTISGWYSISEDSGEVLQIGLDDLRRIEPGTAPGTYLVTTTDPKIATDVAIRLRSAFGNRAEVRTVDRSLSDLDAFRVAFFVLTALVLLVGVVNLIGTMVLSVRERLRDFAVLKTIGFTPRQVVRSVSAGAVVLGGAAAIIGIPLGLVVLRQLLDEVGRSAGFGPGLAVMPSWLGLMLTVIAAVGLTAMVGMLSATRASRTEVSTILRAE